MYSTAFKITIIISLLTNIIIAKQCYALRPAAFKSSDIKTGDAFKKPPTMKSSGIESVLMDISGEKIFQEDIDGEIKRMVDGGFLFNAEIYSDDSMEFSIATVKEGHKSMACKGNMFKGVIYADEINFIMVYFIIYDRVNKDVITIAHEIMALNKKRYDLCIRLARFFLEHGFPQEFVLDEPTRKDLENMRIFNRTPNTIGELAKQPLSSEEDYDAQAEVLHANERAISQIILRRALAAISTSA